jgi:hypothetical protein
MVESDPSSAASDPRYLESLVTESVLVETNRSAPRHQVSVDDVTLDCIGSRWFPVAQSEVALEGTCEWCHKRFHRPTGQSGWSVSGVVMELPDEV